MKQKEFSQSYDMSKKNEELNYDVEGYSTCQALDIRCEQDSLYSGCMWSCDN